MNPTNLPPLAELLESPELKMAPLFTSRAAAVHRDPKEMPAYQRMAVWTVETSEGIDYDIYSLGAPVWLEWS